MYVQEFHNRTRHCLHSQTATLGLTWTQWGTDNVDAILGTAFSASFSCMKNWCILIQNSPKFVLSHIWLVWSLKPLSCLEFNLRCKRYIFISQHWDDTGSWNPPCGIQKLQFIRHIQYYHDTWWPGDRASAATVLTQSPQNIPLVDGNDLTKA